LGDQRGKRFLYGLDAVLFAQRLEHGPKRNPALGRGPCAEAKQRAELRQFAREKVIFVLVLPPDSAGYHRWKGMFDRGALNAQVEKPLQLVVGENGGDFTPTHAVTHGVPALAKATL